MSPTPGRQAEAESLAAFAEDTASAFLKLVFQGQQHGFANLYSLPDKRAAFFDLSTDDWAQRASQAAVRQRATQNVYVAVGTQRARLDRGRGKADTVIALPGLWADIDVRSASHVRKDLPPTFADARKIINALPFRPTVAVQSGYGLQPWWLFREPLELQTPQDHRIAAGLAAAWLGAIKTAAAGFGWHVDSTADLARVLRLPGTFNRKAEEPVLVRFDLTDGEPRYNPSEIMEWLDFEGDPELTRPVDAPAGSHDLGADFGHIIGQCAWMRHCVDDASTLEEPQWYRAVAVAARCTDGHAIAHEISRPHPKYSQVETDKKFQQSVERSRAPRCAFVAANFDRGDYCRKCQHFGRVNSPVKLGFPPRVQRAAETDEPGAPPQETETIPLQQAIEEAMDAGDVGAIYRMADQIATLPEFELAALKADCSKKFGKYFRVSDFNRVVKEAKARVSAVENLSRPDWERELILSSNGTVKPILANAITALRHAPEWQGVLAFDEFALKTVAQGQAPFAVAKVDRGWDDDEYRRTADWLQRRGITVGPDVAWQAIETVARERTFHPVREYLNSLEWDGEHRLQTWLAEYLNAEGDPEYVGAVGEKWLISAVARVFQPGAKADCCLILEGVQGAGKSTALSILAGEWFTDELPDLETKDAAMQCHGVWIIEIGELDTMHRSDVGRIKAFMSRTTDRFRPPFGRGVIEADRQCVFAGSVNHGSYLRDETGGRRFWPVKCQPPIDVDGLRRDRDQLWAEAVARYRDGTKWWIFTPELLRKAEEQQAERYEGDAWDDLVAAWLAKPEQRMEATGSGPHQTLLPVEPFGSSAESVTVQDVLLHCIGKRKDHWTQLDQTRVARVLKSQGWERYRPRDGDQRRWAYKPPGVRTKPL